MSKLNNRVNNSLNKYTLTFERDVEREYSDSFAAERASKLRRSIFVGIAMMLVFTGVEYYISDSLDFMVVVMNIAVICSLFVLLLISTYNHNVAKKLSYFVLSASILISSAYFFGVTYLPSEVVSKTLLFEVCYIVYLIALFRADFLYQIVSVLFATCLFVYTLVYQAPLSFKDGVLYFVFAGLMLLIGIIYIYRIEYQERTNFVRATENKVIKKRYRDLKKEKEELLYKADKEVKTKKSSPEPLEESERELLYKKYKEDREKAARLAMTTIFNAMPEIVCVISRGGTISHASPKFLKVIGKKEISINNDTFQNYLNNNDVNRFNRFLESGLSDVKLLGESFSLRVGVDKHVSVFMKAGRFKSFDKNNYYIPSMIPEEKNGQTSQNPSSKSGSTMSKEDEKSMMEIYEKLKVEYKKLSEEKTKLTEDNNKLNTKNKLFMNDLDKLRKSLKVLEIEKNTEEATKNVDEIRIMNRIATYYSDYISRCQRELIKILEDSFIIIAGLNDRDFVDGYYYQNKKTMLTSLYQAAAVKFRIDLYEYVLNYREKDRYEQINLRNLIQTSLTKLARYFDYTDNMIEVSCPKDLMIKSDSRPIELILQNFVITSLYLIIAGGIKGKILINVRDKKSKIIIEYRDNGKAYEPYYYEFINYDKIDSGILSVNGIEFYLANKIVKKEFNGNIEIDRMGEYNLIRLSLYK